MALQVIGAGMGRTGTLSLKIALEQLGFGPCYHMEEVFAHPEHRQLWVSAAQGAPDWETIFDGYQATVDFPGSSLWRELTDYYSQAKVILSVRDAESWFESTQASIFRPDMVAASKHGPHAEFGKHVVYAMFDGKMNDRQHLVEVFNAHTEAVKSAIAAQRLLVFEAAQGWQPLCDFLDVPIPDTPYPRSNDAASTSAFIDEVLAGNKPTKLSRPTGS
jgi:hypothetical protein